MEATAEKVGLGFTGAVAAGVAVHAGVTAARAAADRKATKNSPMAAFGDATDVDTEPPTPGETTTAEVPEASNDKDSEAK